MKNLPTQPTNKTRLNRTHTIRKELDLTAHDWEVISAKMKKAEIKSFSLYARHMLTQGQIIKRDFSELKTLSRELAGIGRNLNQIAKKANSVSWISNTDLSTITADFEALKSKILVKILRVVKK